MLCLSYSLWYVDCLMILIATITTPIVIGVVDTNLNHMIPATQRSVIRSHSRRRVCD